MRNVLLVSWLLLPIGAWAYHEGPGQDRVALDEANTLLVAAHDAATNERWRDAVKNYEAAIAKLPTKSEGAVSKDTEYRLRLELEKARMKASGLPQARTALQDLVEQMGKEGGVDPQLVADGRQALAQSQFYMTWLMRLEGLDRKEWEPEIEAARQNWRLLAEQAKTEQDKTRHQNDLEASIRLSRIEIEDLQGLPLPGE